ncbi:immune inhibitor A domain-containing protein [Nocardioides xinjiangensis]|uniref:immune inhibitor A domain-containing protein n=1 Tax=Nocardioides xinjiangensis TaxID=2817376 RepID=UPI001B3083AC|nr:immune inhibitor A domain-containing protein [Nocardioides sp. SYSU D00514]
MNKLATGVLAGTATLALGLTALSPAVASSSSDAPASSEKVRSKPDNRTSPQIRRQARLKAKARAMVENGSARARTTPDGTQVVEVAEGEFVELGETGTDRIWTILSEFGTEGSKKLGLTPGPVHDAIPRPDRTQDNSTTWEPSYDKAYYDDLFNGPGESMANFYSAQSNGAYTVDVTTEDWVTVPGNASTYGDNAVEDDGGSWAFIDDTADAWATSSGRSTAELNAYLSQFDVWDRYDFDEDGVFDEADGYIDHFQAVHAGEGEEAGADPDAIWSHRWYAYPTTAGSEGPSVDGKPNLNGGARIGDTDYFIGDYTVEPENGGLGVFAHEYGHDLGLPDFYDTNGGDNGSSFWTTMSSGSWLGHGGPDEGIGTHPGSFGPEEKLFLGWLKYTEVDKGAGTRSITLSPSEKQVEGAYQAVKVNLPAATTTQAQVDIPGGERAWWSGRGDELRNTLTRDVPAADTVTVTADAWYDIEQGYDFLYAQYSVDGGDTWTTAGRALTGAKTRWGGLRFSYKAAGQATKFRFRYATDGGVNGAGAFLDNITIKADRTTFTDDAETEAPGWTVKGWKRSTGTETVSDNRYYLIENRQYVGYDATLAEGPYNFSEAVTRPNWVEFFTFQDGMLVWLVDPTTADNNTSVHPGSGYALPVDATPNSFTYSDGTSPTNRREPFDATFGLDVIDRTCLHKQVAVDSTLETCSGGVPQQATFDDTLVSAYYDAANNPQNSVRVAGEGVKATVRSVDATTRAMLVDVTY